MSLYDDQVKNLAAKDDASLPIQYHSLNVIRSMSSAYANDIVTRIGLQNLLWNKLNNKANKNAVRIWAFQALFSSKNELGSMLEKGLTRILDEPLNQVIYKKKAYFLLIDWFI